MAARLVVAGVVLALLFPFGAPAAPKERAAEHAMVEALNDARRAHHVRPLRGSRWLARCAGGYASRLMRVDAFGHAYRLPQGGGMRALGEAIAMHRGWRPRARLTVRRWLRSSAHRGLVLSSRYGFVGAGLSRGRFQGRLASIWVLRLGGR
jgi:uncharacterized protein YkwD